MENNIRLSLIVPFYGVEAYIEQCLLSMLRQNISEEEYEIICVNDCSPDNSEDIVKRIASQHSNVRLIKHEVNKKLGAARNTGLLAARGKYIWFVDSDDYIEENCLAEILTLCEHNNLEILHFNIRNNDGDIVRSLLPTDVVAGPDEEIISKKQECIEITYPWNRVYERDFLVRNKLFFNDLYGGDVVHTILAVDKCKRMMNINKCYHYYRIDNLNSDTRSANTPEKLYRMNFVLAKAIAAIEHEMKAEWRPLIEECAPWRVNQAWRAILKFRIKDIIEFYNLLRSNHELYVFSLQIADSKTRNILKHKYVAILISPIYRTLRYLRNIIR